MIIKHLLSGTRELGLAVCKEIEILMEEAIKYNHNTMLIAPGQPSTSAAAGYNDDTMDSNVQHTSSLVSAYSQRSQQQQQQQQQTTIQQNLINSFSNLVILSPKTKQIRELQLPSMSLLPSSSKIEKNF
jgi:hypothetical protein